jgi:hypothetical protein
MLRYACSAIYLYTNKKKTKKTKEKLRKQRIKNQKLPM